MSVKIIIVGPAASGKTTLAERMRKNGLIIGMLSTSRPKRFNDDNEYFFEPEADIQKYHFRVQFNNWWYGLNILEFITSDVFIVGPEMLRQIRNQEPETPLIVIYLDIPESIRYERLMQRDMPGDTAIARIGRDRTDFQGFNDYTIRITDPNF